MVFGLSADLEEAEGAVGVEGGVGEHFEEVGLTDVIGAGAGDENPAGAEHLEGAEIEFLVAAESGIEIALALGEGGRVENDGVVAMIGGRVVLEQVKGVGLDPLDLSSIQELMVQCGVLIGDFESGTGAVDAGDLRTPGSEMEGEASLIAEDIESFSSGVLGCSGVVLALVEEGSGLLAQESVVMELDSVHGESGGGLAAV
jgi:hypothetical protein